MEKNTLSKLLSDIFAFAKQIIFYQCVFVSWSFTYVYFRILKL